MGTFIIRPQHLVSGGGTIFDGCTILPGENGWFVNGYPGAGFDIISALKSVDNGGGILANCTGNYDAQYDNFDSGVPISDTIRFDFLGNSYYLDGSSTPIPFASLPAGFTPLTAVVMFNIDFAPAGSAVYNLQQGSGVNGVNNTTSFAYAVAPSSLSLYNNGCGIKVSCPAIGDTIGPIYNLRIEGTYGIASTQYTIDNATTPKTYGDRISISLNTTGFASSGGFSGGKGKNVENGSLFGTTHIDLSWTDPFLGDRLVTIIVGGPSDVIPGIEVDGVFIAWVDLVFVLEDAFLMFYLPPPSAMKLHSGTTTISVSLRGTTFSGSVALGTLDVLFTDGSGIYFLDEDQTHDIFYKRDGFTTDESIKMLPGLALFAEESSIDDFYMDLPYPYKIMAQEFIPDDDNLYSNLIPIVAQRVVIVLRDVEIPSPFAKTGFLP